VGTLYRNLRTSFWRETTDEDFDSQEKLVYAYFITNDSTSACGIYKIMKKTIAWETSLTTGAVTTTMKKLQARGKIYYDPDTKEVILLKHVPYESTSPSYRTRMQNELSKVKSQMIRSLREQIERGVVVIPEEVAEEPKANGDKPKKKAHGEFKNVFLTEDNTKELLRRFGKEAATACVQKLSSWKESKGRSYKNDFAAITGWVAESLGVKRVDKIEEIGPSLICPVCGTDGANVSTADCPHCSFPKSDFPDTLKASEYMAMLENTGLADRLQIGRRSPGPDRDPQVLAGSPDIPLEK
jgi:rubrerythrin